MWTKISWSRSSPKRSLCSTCPKSSGSTSPSTMSSVSRTCIPRWSNTLSSARTCLTQFLRVGRLTGLTSGTSWWLSTRSTLLSWFNTLNIKGTLPPVKPKQNRLSMSPLLGGTLSNHSPSSRVSTTYKLTWFRITREHCPLAQSEVQACSSAALKKADSYPGIFPRLPECSSTGAARPKR